VPQWPLAHIGRPGQKFADLDGNAASIDDDRALGDGQLIGKDPHRVILRRVQPDDGAAAEAQHLMDRHGRGAEHHHDVDGDLVECGHVRIACLQALGHHGMAIFPPTGIHANPLTC
jgi:hypothetical protein